MFKILRGFCLGGGVDVHPGQKVADDLIPRHLTRRYIELGKIEPIEEEGEAKPAKGKGRKGNAE